MRFFFISASSALFLIGLFFVPAADAALFYDVSVKGIYEDNVVGTLSDRTASGPTSGTGPLTGTGTMTGAGAAQSPGMGSGPGSGIYSGSGTKSGDASLALAAELGGGLPITGSLSLFLAGSADRISYSSFTDLDMTAGMISSGVVAQLGKDLTARLAASGAIRRFGDPERDATAYSGNIMFREELSMSFWLKQSFQYEKNRADAAYFSYTGSLLGIWAGVRAASSTTFLAGYQHLVRKYDEPSGFEETAGTITLGLEWEPVKKWFIDLQYDRRSSESNLDSTDIDSNIYSIGIRYSY